MIKFTLRLCQLVDDILNKVEISNTFDVKKKKNEIEFYAHSIEWNGEKYNRFQTDNLMEIQN